MDGVMCTAWIVETSQVLVEIYIFDGLCNVYNILQLIKTWNSKIYMLGSLLFNATFDILPYIVH